MTEYICPQCGAPGMGVKYHPNFIVGFTISDHCFLCGYESAERPQIQPDQEHPEKQEEPEA